MRLLSEEGFLMFLKSWVLGGHERDFDAKNALFSVCCFKDIPAKDARLSDRFVENLCRLLLDVSEKPEKLVSILSIVETEWGAIPTTQKSAVLSCLESLGKKMSDVAALVLIAEILAEYYSNDAAFRVLEKLLQEAHGEKRAILCDGLRMFAISNSQMRENAIGQLRRLSKDHESIVSQEARAMLSRLGQ